METSGGIHDLRAVLAFAGNGEVGLLGDQLDQHLAHQGVVVHDQHADLRHGIRRLMLYAGAAGWVHVLPPSPSGLASGKAPYPVAGAITRPGTVRRQAPSGCAPRLSTTPLQAESSNDGSDR